ncbi:MAG: hypothetical protein MJ106_03070, partial [Lentisphaeria bacterium]|nr:hypothetical protein [Lentisphaeria bacterium]
IMLNHITRNFPLPRIQTGAMLGNGLTGALVWGAEHTLNVTLGNAALWDHRGGWDWSPKQNLDAITEALKKKDTATLKALFESKKPDGIRRATLIPLCRLKFTLPAEMLLETVDTDFHSGVVTVNGSNGLELRFVLAMTTQHLSVQGLSDDIKVELIPAWDLTKAYNGPHNGEADDLEKRGFAPPIRLPNGYIQPFPADPAAIALIIRSGNELCWAFARGTSTDDAQKITFRSFAEALDESQRYYTDFAARIPKIELPDAPKLEHIYYEGAYRYATFTNPLGVSPGLQGAYLEDDQLAPWSGDYHFNVNAQMCSAPGMTLNAPENIRKLFDMVLSWKPRLRRNAECFVGISDGIMLSHAVDDTGKSMGGFWTGMIDHGCAAWVAKMMFEYCDIFSDESFLRNDVYDFMQGVLNVFKKLVVEDGNGKLSMPVTISPEYRGSAMDAWGRNASFQLAALHNLARNMIVAAKWLGRKVDPFAGDVDARLPRYAEHVDADGPEIALLEGLPLRESHRHHSHLGAIAPFEAIDPLSPDNRKLMDNTLIWWTRCGMGSWDGWAMSWAAMIRARCGQAEMAEATLELWQRFFTNVGGGSLHDSPFKGFTEWADFRGEIMQMDGGMGATYAVPDLIVHCYQDELRVGFGTPSHWRHASFENLPARGGFVLSGTIAHGKVTSLKVRATRANTIRIRFAGEEGFISRTLGAGEETTIR